MAGQPVIPFADAGGGEPSRGWSVPSSSRADLVIGDAPADESMAISTDTVVNGDIRVMNAGSLEITGCKLVVHGHLYVRDNGTLNMTLVNLTQVSEWKGHRGIDLTGNGTLTAIQSVFNFNEISNVLLADRSAMGLFGVLVKGGFHFDNTDNSTLLTDGTVLSGELVIWDHSTVAMNNTYGILFWLSFPANSKANLSVGDELIKNITSLVIDNSSHDFIGIDYRLVATDCHYVSFGIIANPLSDVKVMDSYLRAVGNLFTSGSQSVSGFLRMVRYSNFDTGFTDRSQTYVNSRVFTWNFYVAISEMTIVDSVVGEVFSMTGSEVVLHNTTVDGSGGHTEVFDRGRLICQDSELESLTMLHGDGVLEMRGGRLSGRVLVRDQAGAYLLGTERAGDMALQVSDSAFLTTLDIASPLNNSYALRETDVIGTALTFKGPDFSDTTEYELQWARAGGSWTSLASGSEANLTTLAIWNTTSLQEGDHRIRLTMNGATMVHYLKVRDTIPAGDHGFGLEHDGLIRTYRLHVPQGYDGSSNLPTVVALHGGFGNGEEMAGMTGYDDLADVEDFFVLYPNGTLREGAAYEDAFHFNGGPGSGVEDVDDVGFIGTLLDRLEKNVELAVDRVYATGISRGGFMAYRLAREEPERFAAIAPVAAVADPGNFTPLAPVPVMHIHGTADDYVPFDGGELEGQPDVILVSVNDTLDLWCENNGCVHNRTIHEAGGSNTSVAGTRHVSLEGGPYELWTVFNGGHTWPGGTVEIGNVTYGPGDHVPSPVPASDDLGMISSAMEATEETWEFFINRSRWVPGDNRAPVLNDSSPAGSTTVNETVDGEVSFSVNASDPDGHELSYSWMVDGTVINETGTSMVLDFDHSSSGTYEVWVNISDGYETIDHSWTLNITDVNLGPRIDDFSPRGELTVNETVGNVVFSVDASDPDLDPLSYSWTVNDVVRENITARSFELHVDFNSSGTYLINASISDGEEVVVQSWILEVLNVNRRPCLEEVPTMRVTAGEEFIHHLNASDPDQDGGLEFRLIEKPGNMTMEQANGTIRWTPTTQEVGTWTVRVLVTDGMLNDTAGFTMIVERAPVTNHPPVLDIDTLFETRAGKAFEITVNASDPDQGDNERLRFSLEDQPEGMVIDRDSGEITWRPEADMKGEYEISVTVTDGKANTSARFKVKVLEARDGEEGIYGALPLVLVLSAILAIVGGALVLWIRGKVDTGPRRTGEGEGHEEEVGSRGEVEDGPRGAEHDGADEGSGGSSSGEE